MTVSLTLQTGDIALWSDPIGTRVLIPHLVRADPTESDDSTLVHLEGLELPVAYTGTHTDTTVQCLARWTEYEHDLLLAFVDLLRTARAADDRRLLLRTNGGAVGGFDELHVGVVRSIPRTRATGRAYDIPFVLEAVHYDLEV